MIDRKIKYVNKFYNNFGWEKKDRNTLDATLFEDLRYNSKEYVSKCRKRLKNYMPKKGLNILDFASGPIQYPEYLDYSKNFKLRHCVDFSKLAIKNAKLKLGKKGKYYCNDFFKIKLKKNYFDCIISLHTIYHIDKRLQAKAIKKLISFSKRNAPIIIVYSNSNTLINKIKSKFFKKRKKQNKSNLYFFCHPIKWWYQFEKTSNIEIKPWRSFSSDHQKRIFPDNYIGKMLLKILFFCEQRFPNFFVKNFQYYTVIIKKK
mgnify:CR=1 FL=1|tara:strand:+ start:399 stop:1178 length:780 start_codon:yes stop_codon:yes gene_type:complete